MKKELKGIGLRVDIDVYKKIKYIAEYEGRTINGQALYLMRKCIREFEKEYGAIKFDE